MGMNAFGFRGFQVYVVLLQNVLCLLNFSMVWSGHLWNLYGCLAMALNRTLECIMKVCFGI